MLSETFMDSLVAGKYREGGKNTMSTAERELLRIVLEFIVGIAWPALIFRALREFKGQIGLFLNPALREGLKDINLEVGEIQVSVTQE